MSDPVSTALIVAAGTLLTLALQIVRDRGKSKSSRDREKALAENLRDREKALAEKLRIQHEWDMIDRKNHTQVVLAHIDRSREATDAALEAGNNFNEKLLQMDARLTDAMPRSTAILTGMLKPGATVASADLAHVLLELRQDFNQLETYAHDSVHRLSNLLVKIEAGQFEPKGAKQ